MLEAADEGPPKTMLGRVRCAAHHPWPPAALPRNFAPPALITSSKVATPMNSKTPSNGAHL
jgi:hypothetical protein